MTSLLGHDRQRRTFIQRIKSGALHHAWIFAGFRGLGKASFAKQAAQLLLENDPNGAGPELEFSVDPTSSHAKLLAAGSHPDFRLLQRSGKTDKEERKAREEGYNTLEEHELKRNISVAQVRDLQPLFATQPSISVRRVVLIDSIDDLERGAANALLKNLEEPPPNTVFLLVSHAPDRLLPTIRSRCQILRFDPLDDTQMRDAIAAHESQLDDAELSALIAAGEGSPGRALRFVDAGLAELESMARQIMQNGDTDNSIKSELARKLVLKAATGRYLAFLERAPALIAEQVRQMPQPAMHGAIENWREASDLADMAIPKALDPQAVVFRLGSLMGSLAQLQRPA